MEWTEVFIVLVVSHLVGDFLLQTEFQAQNKPGGLGRDPVSRRALFGHIATLALAFVPAAVWIGTEWGVGPAALGTFIVLGTHLVQDDARLLHRYTCSVKHTDATPGTPLWMAIDQSAHVVVLFAVALIVAA
jgi:hypothetical protein